MSLNTVTQLSTNQEGGEQYWKLETGKYLQSAYSLNSVYEVSVYSLLTVYNVVRPTPSIVLHLGKHCMNGLTACMCAHFTMGKFGTTCWDWLANIRQYTGDRKRKGRREER